MKDRSDLPDVIGFDLVSKEESDKGRTEDFSKYIYQNFGIYNVEKSLKEKPECWEKLASKSRIDLIRFFLHDGESMEEIIKSNITDNAITGPVCSRHRIGHGFKMGAENNYKNSEVSKDQCLMGNLISDYILYGCSTDVDADVNYPVKKINEKYQRYDAIAEPVIEFCPISNQLLDYTRDLTNHPAKVLTDNGIFAVVSNDDPQIFDNQGLSYDYLMAYINDVLTYEQIKISVFLGFFYKEMSNYYYIKENDIWVVNDKMKHGTESDKLDDLKDNPADVTEFAIVNKAIEEFKAAWTELNTHIKKICSNFC